MQQTSGAKKWTGTLWLYGMVNQDNLRFVFSRADTPLGLQLMIILIKNLQYILIISSITPLII